MRSHWETSEKSIFVRTVWINGVRHAILSKNDPLLNNNIPKRPYSCGNILQDKTAKRNKKTSSNSTEYYRSTSISTTSTNISSPIDILESSSDIEYEYRFDTDLASEDEDEDFDERKQQKQSEIQVSKYERQFKTKKIRLPIVNSKTDFNNNLRHNHTHYMFLRNNFINPITERVLNWLDLANKETVNNNTTLDEKIDVESVEKESSQNEKVASNHESENRKESTHIFNKKSTASTCGKEGCHQVSDRNTGGDRTRNCSFSRNTSNNIPLIDSQIVRGSNESNYEDEYINNQINKGWIIVDESKHQSTDSNRQTNAMKKKRHNQSFQEPLSFVPRQSNTTNIQFDFQNPTANINNRNHTDNPPKSNKSGQLVRQNKESNTPIESLTKSNPYNKHIRANNEKIRLNNESISRLERNIDEFQRTNEIVCQNARQRNDNNNIAGERVGKVFDNRTRSKHGKNRRSRGNSRICSSRNSEESKQHNEEENCVDDFNDTIRYVIMRKEDEIQNPHHRINSHPTINHRQDFINRSNEQTNNNILSQYFNREEPKIHESTCHASRRYPIKDEALRIYDQTGRRSSKPQLHIFLPRFQNVS